MFDIAMRYFKDQVCSPVLELVKLVNISPNSITLASGFVGLIGVALSALDMRYAAFIVFFFGRILDGVDGAYARFTNQ